MRVQKSFVPGKGFKPASELDDIERHIVRNKSIGNRAHNKKAGTPEQRSPSARGQKIYAGHETPRGKLTAVIASRQQTGRHEPGLLGFSQPDGRGGGRIVVHADTKDIPTTKRHEEAHIKPRRNPVRFHERLRDSTRRGREEGRAEFIANRGAVRPNSYPGNDEFQQGFNEVQGKMGAAKWRKEKFGKSAFGVIHDFGS